MDGYIQHFEWAQIHTNMCMMQSSREQKSSGCQLGSGFPFRQRAIAEDAKAFCGKNLEYQEKRGA